MGEHVKNVHESKVCGFKLENKENGSKDKKRASMMIEKSMRVMFKVMEVKKMAKMMRL